MQIARPVTGFDIIGKESALEALMTASPRCPWLLSTYANIKERLKRSGHKSGFMIRDDDATRRVYVDADPTTLENRLVIAYRVLGDTLTIQSIKVLVIG